MISSHAPSKKPTITSYEGDAVRVRFEKHDDFIVHIALNGSGRLVASSSRDQIVHVWESSTGQIVHSLQLPTAAVALAFSSDDELLATGDAEGTVRIWKLTALEKPPILRVTERCNSLAFQRDGSMLFGFGVNGSKVWTFPTLELKTDFAGVGNHGRGRLNYQGNVMADGTQLWNSDAKVIGSLTGEHDSWGGPFDATFSTHTLIAVASARTVKIRDLQTMNLLHTVEFELGDGWFSCAAFHPEGTLLAVGTGNFGYQQDRGDKVPGRIELYEVSKEACQRLRILEQLPYSTYRLAFSPDGKQLAAACGDYMTKLGDGEVIVWDTTTWKRLFTFKGFDRCVFDVAFSNDGKRLATAGGHYGSERDISPGEVKIWDLTTGQVIMSFRGHTSSVYCVAFSPDGKCLASGDEEGNIRLWGWQPQNSASRPPN